MITSLFVFHPQRSIAEDQFITPLVDVQDVKPLTLEQHVKQIFGDNAEVAMAVFTHESGLDLSTTHYNCKYVSAKNGKVHSKTCKKGDNEKAWSVDCGVAQVNVKGKVCPKKLLTLEGNMEAVEKIYNDQGLSAWVSYTSGAYKKFLKDTNTES